METRALYSVSASRTHLSHIGHSQARSCAHASALITSAMRVRGEQSRCGLSAIVRARAQMYKEEKCVGYTHVVAAERQLYTICMYIRMRACVCVWREELWQLPSKLQCEPAAGQAGVALGISNVYSTLIYHRVTHFFFPFFLPFVVYYTVNTGG